MKNALTSILHLQLVNMSKLSKNIPISAFSVLMEAHGPKQRHLHTYYLFINKIYRFRVAHK